jgi:hypothetical protein
MDYKVVDNFLPEKDFRVLQEWFMGNEFPWFFQADIEGIGIKNNYSYFTHRVFDNFLPSYIFEKFFPLLNCIDIKSLIRLKANCYPYTEKNVTHGVHTDYDYSHKGAIFSINTCNGGTILKDGIKIDSIENRILYFDPSIEHTSTTTNDTHARFNININYF